MFRKLSLGFIFFIFSLFSSAQCADFIIELERDGFIEVNVSKTLEKKTDEFVEQAKQSMKNQLRRDMSEKIVVSVKSSSKSEVLDLGSEFNSYFNENVDISSNANLSFGSFSFCFDKGEKKLHGKFTVNKIVLAESNFVDALNNLSILRNELRAAINSSSKVDAIRFSNRLGDLNTQIRTSIYLNSSLDLNEFDELNNECNSMIAQLKTSQSQMKFDAEMAIIQDSIRVGNYHGAILKLRNLYKDYRDNESIKNDLEFVQAEYKMKVKRQAALWESNARYERAVQEIDRYCSLMVCEGDLISMKEELQQKLFNQIAQSFESALDQEIESDITLQKKRLEKIQDVDFKRYGELNVKYLTYVRNKGLTNALKLMHERKYLESYTLLTSLEKQYGKDVSELNHLKKKVGHKIFRDMVAEEKKKKSHTMAFQLGVEAFSNQVNLDSVASFSLKTFNFAYSGGVYFKYNFADINGRNRSYPVRSDLFGLKATYIDLPSTQVVPGTTDSLFTKPAERYSLQIGIDGITARVFHYGLGVNYTPVGNSVDWSQPNTYYACLGFRLPLGKISWITDAYCKTVFEGDALFMVTSGLHYRFDFNRKFGRTDKLALRTKM